MKRFLLILTVVMVMGAGMLIGFHPPLQAGQTFDNSDLEGTYYFVNMDIREEDGIIKYCSGYGTITLDGNGNGTSIGTYRCNYDSPVTGPGDYTYSVDPDGSFLLTEVGFEATHCKIADKHARMVVCDGTTREPNIFSVIGIAIKQ